MKPDRVFHYVRHDELPDWLLCGWVMVPCNAVTHHHEYSITCEWLCDCPMPRPGR